MEYKGSMHCAVIGHCLTISEQRKLLRKAKYREKEISDYDCHEILTHELAKETPLSIRVQKFIDVKYNKELNYWDDLLGFEYLKTWLSKIDEPHIGGHLYGLIRQTDIQKSDKYKISGLIHLLAFNKVKYYESRPELNKKETISDLQKELSILKTEVRQNSFKTKIIERENLEKEKTNEIQKQEIEKYLTQISNINEIRNENEKLKQKISKINNRNSETENLIKAYRENWQTQKEKINDQTKVITALNKELYDIAISDNKSESKAECELCENYSLCKKRVLIVGGLSKLTTYYKSAVENLDGIFDHNEGYGHNGDLALKESIRKADIILCPVDVNSHNACLSVKRHCKKMDKTYFMLRNSGVSSIKNKLTEISNTQCN